MVTHISLMPQRTGSRIAELCGTLDLAEIETSCSVVDCNDLDLILSKAINEAIVAEAVKEEADRIKVSEGL
jgi:hypothetical protein